MAEKSISFDFHRYLKQLEEEGGCFFLPFELKSAHVQNIGPLSDITLHFDMFNVIEGSYGTGKTALITGIVKACGYDNPNFHSLLSFTKKSYEVTLEIKPEQKLQLTYNENNENEYKEHRTIRCIIIDDPIGRLSLDLKNRFLCYLLGLETQIILTTSSPDGSK